MNKQQRVNVGIYCFDNDKRLFCVKIRKREAFGPPGGAFEYNKDKSIFDAACREFEEETHSKLPGKSTDYKVFIWKHKKYSDPVFIFLKKTPLTNIEKQNLVNNYDSSKIYNRETDDIAFINLDSIRNHRSLVGIKYKKIGHSASFIMPIIKYLRPHLFFRFY